MNAIAHHTNSVRDEARRQGFDACGFAAATVADPDDNLGNWLGRGFAADMAWIGRTKSIRQDVSKKVSNAKSVVVVAKNYFSPRPSAPTGSGRIARYAWGRDYHRVLRKPLNRLAAFIRELAPDVETYCSIDSGPVLERTWAERAGLASIGKNSLALRRDMGSWFFLATIITSLELTPDKPATDICGTCTLCLDACPTGAIVEPRVVDSGRCISYQTIENRGEVPSDLQASHGDWVFGCDICQEVCPWNRFATDTDAQDFHPRKGHSNPDLAWLAGLNEDEFDREFEGTPIRRAKHSGMVRNARIARNNAGECERAAVVE